MPDVSFLQLALRAGTPREGTLIAADVQSEREEADAERREALCGK